MKAVTKLNKKNRVIGFIASGNMLGIFEERFTENFTEKKNKISF